MEFVAPILTAVVESLLVPVKKHLGFLVSSSSMVRKMSTKVGELEDAEQDILTRQEFNINNSRVVPHGVPGWLEEVGKIKASKETIPTGEVGCFNIKTKYVAGKKSSKILEDINRLMGERAAMEWTDQIIPLGNVSPPRPSTSQGVQEEDQSRSENRIKSRDPIFKKALKFLEPNNVQTQMMALCGMGGVGKTTMMKELEKVAKEKKMFDCIVNAALGQNPNPISIQQTVADYLLGVALTETSKDARAERLKKAMENILKEGKKKILVMLDDVWEKFNLEDIGLSSPLPNRFKLLLTSRDEIVCNQMGVEPSLIFKIVVLQEEEAKTLFWGLIGPGLDTDLDPDMHQIGEDILKRCGGLPIAISIIASTLKVNKKKHAWNDLLRRLEKKMLYDLNAIFEISYMNLKEDDLKAIFILSGLFPEDYYIETEDLLRYGWGLNLYKDMRIVAAARDRVHTCVDTLISLNLLIKSDRENCVKMHDLVRDFVLSNFSEVKQASIVSLDNNISEQLRKEVSYERILLKCGGGNIQLREDFNQPDLALLTLMKGKLLRFSQDSFTNMEKLEVVAYKEMNLKSLPRYTTNLRVLSLRSCSFVCEDISFLGDLINLEVLDLSYCCIKNLPSNLEVFDLSYCRIKNLPSKIGKLKRLRILDLAGCDSSLCIDDGVIKNLDKLEELYMEVDLKESSIKFTDANFNELKMIVNKLSALEVEFLEAAQLTDFSFEKLERFRIAVGCLFGDEQEDLDRRPDYDYRSYKNTLKLVTSLSELRACKAVNELFRKTEMLHLEVKDMSCLNDILVHPHHISFCNLRALCISYCGELTHLFTVNVAKGLMRLESLEISSCGVLKSMIVDENSEDGEITFNKLTKLKLYRLPSVTSIFPENSINISSKQPFLNKKVVFPKLEILTIQSMGNLKEVWPCEITSSGEEEEKEVNNTSMLREITMSECDSLENLFPSNPMQLLSHLEELKVRYCNSIEVLFNIEVGKSKHLSSISNLRKIKAFRLKKLREVWRIKDAKNNCSGFLITSFQSVIYLDISNCERFTKIVSPTMANFDLRELVEIRIHECGGYSEINNTMSKEDEALFEIESPHNRDQLVINEQQALPLPLFPYLETLVISEMDSLTHVWKCSSWNEFFVLHTHQPHIQSSFQNLTNISLTDSKSIKYLFSPLMVRLLSSLKKVYINGCHGMEQLVSNRDDKDEENNISTVVNTTTTLLPHLDILHLDGLDNLKHIGGGAIKDATNASHGQSKFSQLDVVHWSLCQYSREICISDCPGLSSVIPSYAAGRMQKLQKLTICFCNAMEEVFETKEINNNNISDCSSSTITVPIPRQKNNIVYKLSNLKTLKVKRCDCLENMFTFSTLESLTNLKTLKISNCKAMKVIVREEYGEGTMTSSKNVVILPNLTSIKLFGLPNLEGFFLGTNIDFQWPLLDYVMIEGCPKMMVLTSGWSTTPRLKYIYTELGKHNVVECDIVTPTLHLTPSPSLDCMRSRPTIFDKKFWSFDNLIECDFFNYADTKIFPSNELQQLQKLEIIKGRRCRNLKEVFEVALDVTNNESQTIVKFPKLREVELADLYSLKYIWKSDQWRILEFPNLTKLSLKGCISLEYVFTCSMVGCVIQLQELNIEDCTNIRFIVKKEDGECDANGSEVMFPNLTKLSLKGCDSLEYVFTCSMVGCVMQLKELHIEDCTNMKFIVKKEDGDCDAKVSENMFPCLKFLKLVDLPRMEGFCEGMEDFTFPSLDTLVVEEVPELPPRVV